MRNKKVVHREYDDTITESVTCDVCRQTYPYTSWGKASCYDVLETVVKMRTGSLYPEGGMGEEMYFDICPMCFSKVLVPLLAERGAYPTVEDWDIDR